MKIISYKYLRLKSFNPFPRRTRQTRKNMLKYLAVVALCLFGAQAQKFLFGMCPEYDKQDNFQLDRFLGKWYEAQTYSHGYEKNLKCVELDFTAFNDTTMDLNIKWKDNKNKEGQIVDTASMVFPAYFHSDMELPLAPSYFVHNGYSYWILGTDYDTYAVVYSCVEYQFIAYFLGSQNLWVLTRDRNPSKQVLNNALEAFSRNTFLEKRRLRNSNQKGC